MSPEEFKAKFPDIAEHSDCLEDLACPKCGYRECFKITGTGTFTVTEDGISDTEYCDWDADSGITCRSCGHDGTVAGFTIKGLDEFLHGVKQSE
jgi:DNA-directed RNA polymerase subunit RPC12/RpoP